MEPIKMQTVINYMEANLTDEMSMDTLAALVALSESDLQRSFKAITGLTISEYIRNRRLTKAAMDLKTTGETVLQIALTYGYQTAESFNRAFKQFHGCTPTEARDTQQATCYLNPLVVKLAKRGGNVTEFSDISNCKHGSVISYYSSSDEHNRLRKNKKSRIEFLVTMEYLNRILPKHSRILDCCAGTGIYSFALAGEHQVTASDLSPCNVKKMEEIQRDTPLLNGIFQLDVCNLGAFDEGAFDVVLCMGALYHLLEEKDRIAAIEECKRVCKPGGILVFAYLNKWGSFFNGLANHLKPMELLYEEFDSRIHEGIFYRSTPEEMDAVCSGHGLKQICNVGVDHLSFLAEEQINAMLDEEFSRFLGYQLAAAEEPGLKAMSLHGLWIGTKC